MKDKKRLEQPDKAPFEEEASESNLFDDIARRIAVLVVKQHRYLLEQEKRSCGGS